MRKYQCKNNSPGKWSLIALLFILAMTFSAVEVGAFNFQYHPGGNNGNVQPVQTASQQQSIVSPGGPDTTDPPPTAVPEPTTILLMASGLGVVFWNKGHKKD